MALISDGCLQPLLPVPNKEHMSRTITAIDIQDHGVAAVQIVKSLKSARLDRCIYVPVTDWKEESGGSVKKCLEEIAQRMDIRGTQCISSFPASRVSFRNLQVPFKEPKKIRQILPFELESHMPVSPDDMITDFIPVAGTGEHSDVIAAAVEKMPFQTFLQTLTEHGMEPETVTIGGYAALLTLLKMPKCPDEWILADINIQSASVYFVVDGCAALIRSFSAASASSSGLQSLCAHIQQTVSAFEDIRCRDFSPEQIMIIGNALTDGDIEQKLSRLMQVPVNRPDLKQIAHLDASEDVDRNWQSHVMANALAMALCEMHSMEGPNFRRGLFSPRKQWKAHRKQILITGIAALIVACLALLNAFIDTRNLSKTIAGLDQQMASIFMTSFPDVKHIVDPVQQMKVRIQEAEKSSMFSLRTRADKPVIDVLNEISRLIPESIDVEMNRMVIDEENVTVSGHTDTFNSVDDMKGRLESSTLFNKVTITSANMDRTDKRVRFKLKIML